MHLAYFLAIPNELNSGFANIMESHLQQEAYFAFGMLFSDYHPSQAALFLSRVWNATCTYIQSFLCLEVLPTSTTTSIHPGSQGRTLHLGGFLATQMGVEAGFVEAGFANSAQAAALCIWKAF